MKQVQQSISMSALKIAIKWLPPYIREDIYDSDHFKKSQKRLVLADGYVEDIKTIRRALALEGLPAVRDHRRVK